jgi:hypothetical protein
MQIKVSVNRKTSVNFQSTGASCELAIDVSEQSVSQAPDSLRDEIRRAYRLCEEVVTEQLGRHQGAEPEPAPEPDRSRLPSQARPPSEPEPRRDERGADRTTHPPATAGSCTRGRKSSRITSGATG